MTRLVRHKCSHCGEVLMVDYDGDAFRQGFDHAWNSHPATLDAMFVKAASAASKQDGA